MNYTYIFPTNQRYIKPIIAVLRACEAEGGLPKVHVEKKHIQSLSRLERDFDGSGWIVTGGKLESFRRDFFARVARRNESPFPLFGLELDRLNRFSLWSWGIWPYGGFERFQFVTTCSREIADNIDALNLGFEVVKYEISDTFRDAFRRFEIGEYEREGQTAWSLAALEGTSPIVVLGLEYGDGLRNSVARFVTALIEPIGAKRDTKNQIPLLAYKIELEADFIELSQTVGRYDGELLYVLSGHCESNIDSVLDAVGDKNLNLLDFTPWYLEYCWGGGADEFTGMFYTSSSKVSSDLWTLSSTDSNSEYPIVLGVF